MYNSQTDLENEMAAQGSARAARFLEKNEEQGRAANNPYANTIFRRFVRPLAEKIQSDLDAKGAGKRKAHTVLLQSLEPELVAYIAIRTVMVDLLEDSKSNNGRGLCYAVGKNIQGECVLRQFENESPESFWAMQKELTRRHSQDIRHRLTLTSREMRKQNITPIDWGHGSRDQVGAYLCESMAGLGLIEITRRRVSRNGKHKDEINIELTDEIVDLIATCRGLIEETMPYFLPTIEEPRPWVSLYDGGFHTDRVRKMAGGCIINGNPGGGDLTQILEALNALQSVRWSINGDVLDVVKSVIKAGIEMEEIVSPTGKGKPEKPSFLDSKSKDEMTPKEVDEFKAWKRKASEWYTDKKLRMQKYGRQFNAVGVADKFRNEGVIHFVYHADFRGRFYPHTTGVNPQGSDLQKALLHFADGMKLETKEARHWFYIHGANKWGEDKSPFNKRIGWVIDNHDMLMGIANDPIGNREWMKADSPWQFLAWVLEYAELSKYGERFFESKLPISMDGSCNGLQNFSAALRDEIGGRATNLVPSDKPHDIYTEVADVLRRKLAEMPEDEKHYRTRWEQHGIKRKLVKRSVMTLPYGSTMFSARDFILKDYLQHEDTPEFDRTELKQAASFLAKPLWASIGDVVVKAREAMNWLQKCSGVVLKQHKDIRWRVPGGFVVCQDYRSFEQVGQIRVSLFGGAKFSMSRKSEAADPRRHRNGIAPNFVHSLDAAHMQRVAIRCKKEGINSLAMIHDDFGTHAAHAERFNRIIREEFVAMYTEADWLEEFHKSYTAAGSNLPPPPSKGKLDINQVLESKYFFA